MTTAAKPKLQRIVVGTASLTSTPFLHKAIGLLQLAYDLGVREFDTAPLYGQGYAELILGKFMKQIKRPIRINTKFGLAPDVNPKISPMLALPLNYLRKSIPRRSQNGGSKAPEPAVSLAPKQAAVLFDRDYVHRSLTGSLKRLGVDRIDGYFLHEGVPAMLSDEALDFLVQKKTDGVIGRLGIATTSSHLLNLGPNVSHHWDALQYEFLPEVADELTNRFPMTQHRFHSMVKYARNLGHSVDQTISYVSQRYPEATLIFATRSRARMEQNIQRLISP